MDEQKRAPIFISHATADDAFVKRLRTHLEALNLPVWVDSRNLRGGDRLAEGIGQAIRSARQVLVVLSPNTVNSPWVRREIRLAEQVAIAQSGNYRVIPLLLDGIEPSALDLWFDPEPVGVPVKADSVPGGLIQALPGILAALGERLQDDFQPYADADARPLEELLLKLTDPRFVTEGPVTRVRAGAELIYQPADPAKPRVESRRFQFTASFGPIEAEELRWYLEKYYIWPTGLFQERAGRIEAQLPGWGRELFRAAVAGAESARTAFNAWQETRNEGERRFSVQVDSDPPEDSAQETQAATAEAATRLLALPWELLHDGHGYLFQGAQPVVVRRRLPNRRRWPSCRSASCWSARGRRTSGPATSTTASAPAPWCRRWPSWAS